MPGPAGSAGLPGNPGPQGLVGPAGAVGPTGERGERVSCQTSSPKFTNFITTANAFRENKDQQEFLDHQDQLGQW